MYQRYVTAREGATEWDKLRLGKHSLNITCLASDFLFICSLHHYCEPISSLIRSNMFCLLALLVTISSPADVKPLNVIAVSYVCKASLSMATH